MGVWITLFHKAVHTNIKTGDTMFNPNLTLEEIFVPNSLRNLRTVGHDPMPHTGNTYYIWFNCYCDKKHPDIKRILEEGNHWKPGCGYTINSYITMSDKAGDLVSSRLIMQGPQSISSSFTVEITEEDNSVRMIAQGWGTSSILLYDGDKETFLKYLQMYQSRTTLGENYETT